MLILKMLHFMLNFLIQIYLRNFLEENIYLEIAINMTFYALMKQFQQKKIRNYFQKK